MNKPNNDNVLEENIFSNNKLVYSFALTDYFKFNSSHFVVGKNFREFLHGHNYKVSVEIESFNFNDLYENIVNEENLINSTEIICKKLHGKMLIPSLNENIIINKNTKITSDSNDMNSLKINGLQNIEVKVIFDDSIFVFPDKDCVLVDIKQISAELLSKYICDKLIESDFINNFKINGISYKSMTVKVSEDIKKSSSFKILF